MASGLARRGPFFRQLLFDGFTSLTKCGVRPRASMQLRPAHMNGRVDRARCIEAYLDVVRYITPKGRAGTGKR
jgi:hypothetical protein